MKFLRPASRLVDESEKSQIVEAAQNYVRGLVRENERRQAAGQPSMLAEVCQSDNTTLSKIIEAIAAEDAGGIMLSPFGASRATSEYAVSPADMALVCYLLRERPSKETLVADPILEYHIKQMFETLPLDTIYEAVESRLESYKRFNTVSGSEIEPADVADALRSELAVYEHNALK